ncbi:MAG: FecR family protein [Bdellovibrionota bacterium]
MKNHSTICFCITTLIALISYPAIAGPQIGTITQAQGAVTLLFNPSPTLPNHKEGTSRALFEKEYYHVRPVQPADRVERGNVISTAPNAKARVVFDNGDQFNIGPGTSYRITWDNDTANAKTHLKLMYGKLRGVIAKGGPRSRIQIKTRSATMGVRGTDFFIADDGVSGETEISILRGSVEVKSAAPAAKPVELKSGFSATLAAAPISPPVTQKIATQTNAGAVKKIVSLPPAMVPAVEIRQTTQEELIGIQKSSQIKPPEKLVAAMPSSLAPSPGPSEIPSKTQQAKSPATVVEKKIMELEAKAVKNTLEDIKYHDPQLYAKLDTKKVENIEEVNSHAIKKIFQSAPKAPTPRKPYLSELEDLEKGAYERYFKVLD